MSAPGDEDASSRLFEMANARTVSYATPRSSHISIRQDPANSTTGGCVWETAYLLARWLEREIERGSEHWCGLWKEYACGRGHPVRCLEVGAGCGLLGIALAHQGGHILLTETNEAMPNLSWNVDKNKVPDSSRGVLSAQRLHWGDDDDICAALCNGPFDLLLGTDVIYCVSLVEPLLRTLRKCAHAHSTCWLCCQVRCPDSHAEMMRLAPAYFAEVRMREMTGFMYADELECFLLELRQPHGADLKPHATSVGSSNTDGSSVDSQTDTGGKCKRSRPNKDDSHKKRRKSAPRDAKLGTNERSTKKRTTLADELG